MGIINEAAPHGALKQETAGVSLLRGEKNTESTFVWGFFFISAESMKQLNFHGLNNILLPDVFCLGGDILLTSTFGCSALNHTQ